MVAAKLQDRLEDVWLGECQEHIAKLGVELIEDLGCLSQDDVKAVFTGFPFLATSRDKAIAGRRVSRSSAGRLLYRGMYPLP